MLIRVFVRALTVLAVVAMMVGQALIFSPPTQALEQGTVTVTKAWAPGQEPNEVVEVCFVVTSDSDGADVLGEACSFDESYTVSFGPSNPALATGVTYYVWEDVGPGWTMTGENPIEFSIPNTTGETAVQFENERAAGMATITIHKSVCDETTVDLYGRCHDERVADVRFVIKGERVQTDDDGEISVDVASGPVRITEAAVDFAEQATAGAAYLFCSVVPGGDPVLYDGLTDHRTALLNVPAGATVVCDWYDLTSAGPAPATLELHKRVCPDGPPTGDIFEECHEVLPEQPVAFAVDDGEARYVNGAGNVSFTGLTGGAHSVSETEGPPLAYVELAVWCSVQGTDQGVFQVETDGPTFNLVIGQGQHVICDVYNIPQDLSGRTPTPVSDLTLEIDPSTGQDGETVRYEGKGYTPGGAVVVLMTGDGLIVAETQADESGAISGIFVAAERDRLTGESTNEIPVFAIDQETGRESNRITFVYLSQLPTATATATPVPPTPTNTPTPVIGRPIHVHPGTCGNLGDDPQFNLNDLTTPERTSEGSDQASVAEASYSVIDISLDELLDGEFAINAHPSHEEMRPFVACGEIGGPRRADGSVVVGIREQNGSGMTGIAYLIPDPVNPDRVRVSVFLTQGLAEEDPTLQFPAGDDVIIRSTINNGPVSPEFQAGYRVRIFADGTAEIVVMPPGASDELDDDDRTADPEINTVQLSEGDLTELLEELHVIGYFDLTLVSEIDPDQIAVGDDTSLLAVTVIDGTWEVDGNGLPEEEAEILEQAQEIVADAVGGVEMPDVP